LDLTQGTWPDLVFIYYDPMVLPLRRGGKASFLAIGSERKKGGREGKRNRELRHS